MPARSTPPLGAPGGPSTAEWSLDPDARARGEVGELGGAGGRGDVAEAEDAVVQGVDEARVLPAGCHRRHPHLPRRPRLVLAPVAPARHPAVGPHPARVPVPLPARAVSRRGSCAGRAAQEGTQTSYRPGTKEEG